MPFELVTLAFDRTVEKKGTPKKSYMGGILRKWHESGLTTVDAVIAHEQQTREQNGGGHSHSGQNVGGATGESTFDIDDFFQAALDRSFAASGQSADGGKKE